jgi:PPM family protein phosphatase
VKRLVRAANDGGGVDNITVLVLDISLDSADPGAAGRAATGARTAAGDAGGRAGTGIKGRPSGPARPGLAARDPSSGRRRRRLLRRIVLWAIAMALVVVVAGFGLRFYLDQQWYVGVSNGRVAVFRGVPSEVLGLRLNRAVVVTPLSSMEVGQLAFYAGLSDGITAENRSAADQIVAQMTSDLRAKQAAEERAKRQADRQRRREQRKQHKHHKRQERNAA